MDLIRFMRGLVTEIIFPEGWKNSSICQDLHPDPILLGKLPQWLGRCLLRWSQFRARALAARSRCGVMLSETDIQKSLGFTVGRDRGGNG